MKKKVPIIWGVQSLYLATNWWNHDLLQNQLCTDKIGALIIKSLGHEIELQLKLIEIKFKLFMKSGFSIECIKRRTQRVRISDVRRTKRKLFVWLWCQISLWQWQIIQINLTPGRKICVFASEYAFSFKFRYGSAS